MNVLGISCWYHDAAACLLVDGKIVAAAQEERFTRKKHDPQFPENAVRYCLAEGGVGPEGPDAIVFYDKPILKFHRILETYFSVAPRGLTSFMKAVPLWIRSKLWVTPRIQDALKNLGVSTSVPVYFSEHHESHAASAFFASPFQEAAVVTLDGVGEWATATLGVGEANRVQLLKEIRFPHSLGLLYSAFTYFIGFRVNSGEYKLMGLAPYGEPVYADLIRDNLIHIKEDGSFRLNQDYFGYLSGSTMTNKKFADLFGGPPRSPESPITQREMDMARSIQEVTEEIVLKIARHARTVTGKRYLCLAGGVALNCVANGRILREEIYEDIWIQPASGDAGGALGAALAYWHHGLGRPREADNVHDKMQGALLGPEFSPESVRTFLEDKEYPYHDYSNEEWASTIARFLEEEKVVGLCHGRMEFGPRALGNRSIIGDARSPRMQSIMNLKIKNRESFRPFAPSCREEDVGEFFELKTPSPYMLLVAPVHPRHRKPLRGDEGRLDIKEWVNRPRSDVPAVTHVDFSARVQTVNQAINPSYHAIIEAFRKRTGFGIIINTSFNVRGEPIVCTPEDAYRCFMRTEMDVLVLGPYILLKKEQTDRG